MKFNSIKIELKLKCWETSLRSAVPNFWSHFYASNFGFHFCLVLFLSLKTFDALKFLNCHFCFFIP